MQLSLQHPRKIALCYYLGFINCEVKHNYDALPSWDVMRTSSTHGTPPSMLPSSSDSSAAVVMQCAVCWVAFVDCLEVSVQSLHCVAAPVLKDNLLEASGTETSTSFLAS